MGLSSVLLLFVLLVGGGVSQDFDREYVGVAFSPYVKLWENGAIPYYNSYSLEDIKIMLKIIGTKFSSVSTYGMGVADYNSGQPWDNGDSNCLIARAAAQLNKEANKKLFTVNQGVYQVSDNNIGREIDNAFTAADDANSIYPGTVTGITFTNEYIVDGSSAQKVLDMIRNNKGRAAEKGLKIGTRSHICGEIYNAGGLQGLFNEITKASDYIMCNVYPASKDVGGGTQNAVLAVGNYFLYLRDGFRAQNPNIEVLIGETGWPDQGKSFNDSPNTIENLRDFWVQMGSWAKDNKVKVQIFEAFDEPWKSDENNADPNNPGGRFGAEGHYGWWKRTANNDPNAYVDKVTGTKP